MKRKLLSLALAVLMITAITPMFAVSSSATDGAITADETWYDENATELIIYDEADFVAFMDTIYASNPSLTSGYFPNFGETGNIAFSGVTVKLANDIDLNPGWSMPDDIVTTAPTLPSTYWNAADGKSFGGDFDGQGHTIKGLYINSSTAAAATGIFGVACSKDGTPINIENVSIVNSYFLAQSRVSAVLFASISKGTTVNVNNVYIDSDVQITPNGNQKELNLAGICGVCCGTLNINNVVFNGTIYAKIASTNKTDYSHCGSVVGYVLAPEQDYPATVNVNNYVFDGYIRWGSSGYEREAGKLVGQIQTWSTFNIKNSIILGTCDLTNASTADNARVFSLGGLCVADHIYTKDSAGNKIISVDNSAATPTFKMENCLWTPAVRDGSYIAGNTGIQEVGGIGTPSTTNTGKKITSSEALAGIYGAEAVLSGTGYDLTGFTPMVGSAPMPTAMVSAMVKGTQLVGYQVGVVDETAGTYSIRLIAVGNDTDYTKVGMNVSIAREGYETLNFGDKDTDIVYNRINGRENGETVIYNTENLGGTYAFVANNAPFTLNDGILSFTVTTYHYEMIDEVETKVVDSTARFTVDSSTLNQ